MSLAASTRIPTVNDLRVKLCYICHEDERYDDPLENPPRAWTHPCTCTLVAHETCLLHWIQTSQADASRAPNALKCPQCGTKYELVSRRPLLLRLLGTGNGALQYLGKVTTLALTGGTVAIFVSGVYAAMTIYGAWAVKQFIGEELFDILLTSNTANWSWTTFLNLPTIPLTLILSRFQHHPAVSLVPILLVWPSAPPVGYGFRYRPSAASVFSTSPFAAFSSIASGTDSTAQSPSLGWPPAPGLVGLVLEPIVRAVYRRLRARVQVWVLGSTPSSARTAAGADGIIWDGWPIVIRIRANVNVRGAGQGQGQVGPGAGQGQDAEAVGQDLQRQQPQALEAPGDPADQALNAAEQTITISRSSLGRRVGGALLIPFISSRMGSLLLYLSKHSSLLRRILAIKPPLSSVAQLGGSEAWRRFPYGTPRPGWEGMGPLYQMWEGFALVTRVSWRGTRVWSEADPVWWRNALGLGLFIVAKDALELLHLYLATRELASRHVKNRDFSNVDVRSLDLVPGFPMPPGVVAAPEQRPRARSFPGAW